MQAETEGKFSSAALYYPYTSVSRTKVSFELAYNEGMRFTTRPLTTFCWVHGVTNQAIKR
jgi:hypothetical protein